MLESILSAVNTLKDLLCPLGRALGKKIPPTAQQNASEMCSKETNPKRMEAPSPSCNEDASEQPRLGYPPNSIKIDV